MKKHSMQILSLIILASIIFYSCKKAWLDEKPNQSFVVPTTLQDLQLLLDNSSVFNQETSNLGESGSDNYYIDSARFASRRQSHKNIYTWSSSQDFYEGETIQDWDFTYKQVFYTNVVLEQLEKIKTNSGNIAEWEKIKGSALFLRAYAFYNLAQIFAKPYSQATANTDMGILLRLSSDINIRSARSTVKATYDQIIDDMEKAKDLLPPTPSVRTRPSKHAVFAMLARIYLTMENYNEALKYADSSLQISNILMDYNGLSAPFPMYNPEVIFYTQLTYIGLLPQRNAQGRVDTILFASYVSNDLRRTLFFQTFSGRLIFRGNYTNSSIAFSGLATDEMYLIKAECHARAGDATTAIQVLNLLYQKRWRNTVAFVPLSAIDAEDALRKVLIERRKELLIRGLRWTDLRRLNMDNRFKITLRRLINGQTYTLPPNDNRYIYPIPNNEILYNNIEQNPR